MKEDEQGIVGFLPMITFISLSMCVVSFCLYVMVAHDVRDHYFLRYALDGLRARIIGKYVLLAIFAGAAMLYFFVLKKLFALGRKKIWTLCLVILFGVLAGFGLPWIHDHLPSACMLCRRSENSQGHNLPLKQAEVNLTYEDRALIMYQWKLLCQSVPTGTIFAAILSMLDTEEARQCAHTILSFDYRLPEDRIDTFLRLKVRDQMLLCMLCENARARIDTSMLSSIGRLDDSDERFLLLARDLWGKVGQITKGREKFTKWVEKGLR